MVGCLGVEFLIPELGLLRKFRSIAFLDFGQLILVPAVKASVLIDLGLDVVSIGALNPLSLPQPLRLLVVHVIAQRCIVLIAARDFGTGPLLLLIKLIEVDLLGVGGLALLLLNLVHELLDLHLELLLEALLHFGVFFQLLGRRGDRDLELLSCLFAFKLEGLLFLNVLLQVIENLQLVIQSYEGVQLVL